MKTTPSKKCITLLSVIVILLTLSACVEEIELDLDQEDVSRLIVQGMVTDNDSVQTVKLTKTAPYDDDQPCPPATGAYVSIQSGNQTWVLNEALPGIYQSNEFVGQVGENYQLMIDYEGEIYLAESTMQTGFDIDSIEIIRFPYGLPADLPHYEILLFGEEVAPNNGYYLFEYAINDVWTDTLSKANLLWLGWLHSDRVEGGQVSIFTAREEVFEVQLRSFSINEEYFMLLNNCFVNLQPNMFFSPPKANVPGNISNDALGFFIASSVHYSSKRLVHKKDFFP